MRVVIRLIVFAGLVGCAAANDASPAGKGTPPAGGSAVAEGTPRPPADTNIVHDSIRRPQMPLVPVPSPLRGLYVNRWAAIGDRMWSLIEVAKRTEVNALVIDVKDDRGLVLYHSTVPLAKEIGADTTRPMSYR